MVTFGIFPSPRAAPTTGKGAVSRPDVRPSLNHRLDRNGLEVLGRAHCLELLGTVPIGRIVYTHRALPAIRPVNFAVHEDHIVIRTSGTGSLTNATRGSVVAFQADHFADEPSGAWSVMIIGRAREVSDPERIRRLSELRLEPWTEGRGGFITISIETISGRRIPAATSPARTP